MTKEKEFNINAASNRLLELFEEFSEERQGVSFVSEEGLQSMSIYFGTVPRDERGEVFITFLFLLYSKEYYYNVRQFSDMEEIDEE